MMYLLDLSDRKEIVIPLPHHTVISALGDWRNTTGRRVARFVIVALYALLVACNDAANEHTYLDQTQLRNEALGLADAWIEHAPLSNGFQRTRFDANWQAAGDNNTVNLTSQARLIYVYAAAFDLSRDDKFLTALRSAAEFMLQYMQRRGEVGWFEAVDRAGSPTSKGIHTYGYSFAVFAMAHAYRVTGDQRYLEQAMITWQSGVWHGLEAARSWQASGRLPSTAAKKFWSQNPYMHLFEGLLALHEATQSPAIWADIEAMAGFMEEKLLQPCGCLPEWYVASNFSPQDSEDTRVYLGHQVEWAFLLSRAVRQGLEERYLDTANTLLSFALRHGVDRETGGLRATSTMSGQVRDQSYWWWAQAELMRATVHFAREYGRNELWPIYENAHLFARIHFIDQVRGGWTRESPFFEDKVSGELRQVIGYHWMAFYVESILSPVRE